ncbi:MAG: ATP-binding cassette domain-containing protein [Desulfobacterales bacterium]|jgi:oligopeptide/dipeptide ABC transporter ATP-binding protein|nr:ATP-binding cassette domain-containing protein [Desulfobacterales bacterium]
MTADRLLEVRDLKVYFPIREGLLSKTVGYVYAVDGVGFDVHRGETLGLVGESGCGKTTAGRGILRLVEPTAGKVLFEGKDVLGFSPAELKTFRCKAQIVFQDPYASLNPRMRIGEIVAAPLDIHGIGSPDERRARVRFLLEKVGLRAEYMDRYPHEFSGGQRQRIGVARALAIQPQLIIGDEPFSALDVSVQAQVINLFRKLQEEFHLSYVIIAHNLSVVRHISDRIAVMYLGRIAEVATSDDLHEQPLHPYTQALLSSIPVPNPHLKRTRIPLEGDVPSAISPPVHCKFHTRCPRRFEPCDQLDPLLREAAPGHWVACHLYADPAGRA